MGRHITRGDEIDILFLVFIISVFTPFRLAFLLISSSLKVIQIQKKSHREATICNMTIKD